MNLPKKKEEAFVCFCVLLCASVWFFDFLCDFMVCMKNSWYSEIFVCSMAIPIDSESIGDQSNRTLKQHIRRSIIERTL